MEWRQIHKFVVCAYKESPYLEDCLISLQNQILPSEIVLCTSTPNDYILSLADKYHIDVRVNPNSSDILFDWNFAYRTADTEYVTLVHQDDIYDKRYTTHLQYAIQKHDDMIIFFTNYRPLKIKKGKLSTRKDINCKLRTFLSLPMLNEHLSEKRRWKRGILVFGNSICCSSVTYCKSRINKPEGVFDSDMRFSLDWDMFAKLADYNGKFVKDKEVLTFFRIHKDATSKKCIESCLREKEDREMFESFWPKPIAHIMCHFYKLAYRIYK